MSPTKDTRSAEKGSELTFTTAQRLAFAALFGVWVVMAMGCNRQNQYEEPPPPSVTVARPVQQSVTDYIEETGTTEAVQQAEVRAQVTGFLEQIKFEPGDEVSYGDVLYVIQQREFQAKLDAAQAELDAQKAELERAKTEYGRELELQSENATSEREVVAAKAARDAAQAAVGAALAELDLAQKDMDDTEVRALISGRVGKTADKIGNLVDGIQATRLTTIIQYDPIYANFNISESTLLRIRGVARDRDERAIDKKTVKLYLQRANDKGFPFEGHFDYADLAVDQSTGTFMIRGIFPNSDYDIVPGLFVRIRLPMGVRENALLVPERAIGADQRGRYVLVVTGQDEVKRRNVTLGAKREDMVVIEDGLTAQEWVIVEGLQRARPGTKVSPQQTELSAPAADLHVGEEGDDSPDRSGTEDVPSEGAESDATPNEE